MTLARQVQRVSACGLARDGDAVLLVQIARSAYGEAGKWMLPGGGIVESPDTYSLLKKAAVTVWLRAEPEDHWNRVVRQGDRRPMADHPQAMADLRALLAARDPLYASADHTVDTSGRAVGAIVDDLSRTVYIA